MTLNSCLPACPVYLQARYLRAILTSLAKCGQLEAALSLVQEAKEEELQVGGISLWWRWWGGATGGVDDWVQ